VYQRREDEDGDRRSVRAPLEMQTSVSGEHALANECETMQCEMLSGDLGRGCFMQAAVSVASIRQAQQSYGITEERKAGKAC
jgi:hypothetical protein